MWNTTRSTSFRYIYGWLTFTLPVRSKHQPVHSENQTYAQTSDRDLNPFLCPVSLEKNITFVSHFASIPFSSKQASFKSIPQNYIYLLDPTDVSWVSGVWSTELNLLWFQMTFYIFEALLQILMSSDLLLSSLGPQVLQKMTHSHHFLQSHLFLRQWGDTLLLSTPPLWGSYYRISDKHNVRGHRPS